MPSSRVKRTFCPSLCSGLQPVWSRMWSSFGFLISEPTSGAAAAMPRPPAGSRIAALSSGRRLMPVSSTRLTIAAPVSCCSSRGDGPSWRSWTDDLLGQQLLGPRDDGQAEQHQRAAEAEPEQRREELRGHRAAARRRTATRCTRRPTPNANRPLSTSSSAIDALDPLLGLGAAGREPGRVVDDLHAVAAGALADQVEPAQRRVVDVERVDAVPPCRAVIDAHDFPAIQSVVKTSATMPIRKIARPSVTGPSRPMPQPPGSGSFCRFWM